MLLRSFEVVTLLVLRSWIELSRPRRSGRRRQLELHKEGIKVAQSRLALAGTAFIVQASSKMSEEYNEELG